MYKKSAFAQRLRQESTHLFDEIRRVFDENGSNNATYKFMDLWFSDPSVTESVFAAINKPNLCFLHPIHIDTEGNFLIHNHLGRNNYNVSAFDPDLYRNTVIAKCQTQHMAIPLMFDNHANMLLVTVADKTIVEHFEPHGPVYDTYETLHFNVEHKAIQLATTLFGENIQYISPANVCGIRETGPQWEVRDSITWNGTCTLWAMLYAFKRLINPQIPYRHTYNEIQTMAQTMKSNDELIKKTVETFMTLISVDEDNYTVNGTRTLLPITRRNISNTRRLRKGGSVSRQSLLVVFDIDETLIHYVPAKFYSLWVLKKHLFPKASYVEIVKKNGTIDVVIFRPHLQQLFDYFNKTKKGVRAAIWTYSERDYAKSIANTLIKRFHLPADFFLFLKGGEDIDDENDYPKNLRAVYREYPQYNVFNTVLIDDRYTNIRHEVNSENGLLIEQFAPFGSEKTRIQLPDAVVQNMILNDRVMLDAQHILKAVYQDIMGCDDADIDEGFTTEPVFTERRVKRMGLLSYLQSFAIKPQSIDNIVSIGTPYLTTEFVIVKPGLELSVDGNYNTIKTFGKSPLRGLKGAYSADRQGAYGADRQGAFNQSLRSASKKTRKAKSI